MALFGIGGGIGGGFPMGGYQPQNNGMQQLMGGMAIGLVLAQILKLLSGGMQGGCGAGGCGGGGCCGGSCCGGGCSGGCGACCQRGNDLLGF